MPAPETKEDRRDAEMTTQDVAQRRLVRELLIHARTSPTRAAFLRSAGEGILAAARCDEVELRVHDRDHFSALIVRANDQARPVVSCPCRKESDGTLLAVRDDDPAVLIDVAAGRFDPSLPCFTPRGSLWITAANHDGTAWLTGDEARALLRAPEGATWNAVAWIPLRQDGTPWGLLRLSWVSWSLGPETSVEAWEDLTDTLTLVLAQRRDIVALRERVKELTCLYGVAQVLGQSELPVEEVLARVVWLLPPAWQYPDVATARIRLDEAAFATDGCREAGPALTAELVVAGAVRGFVEVRYREDRPVADEGPFLKEERSLLDAIARQLSLVLEERQARAERSHLQDQLLHADRLATIGQLAAGVAHELNEPLGNILGFAQLVQKVQGLPAQAMADTDKIVKAALHAREVVRKLLIFARRAPFHRLPTDLNTAIEEALFFLEARCTKEGIGVVRRLAPSLPQVHADPAQLRQVVVNLVVNAMQAMGPGGTLTVTTALRDDGVALIVEDTGAGMSREALSKIFVPFYTTKGGGQGTGLGLPVVHGIVTSHGGTIHVESREGVGTRFEIWIPVRCGEVDAGEG